MVLESVVADLLNRFLGDYVENLNKSQLKLGIWGGNVALDNLQITENALSELDVPFKVKAGQIDKLTLKIPWKNLYGEAVVATLEGLYLLVVPGANKPKEAKKDTFLEKLATQVIKNVQVKITDIHIKYEDDDLEKSLDVFNIILVRQQAQVEIIHSGQKLRKKSAESGEKRGWFSGFWGKKDSKKIDEDSLIPETIDDLMTPEEKDKLFTAIGYSESTYNLALPKQYVAHILTLKLVSTSITIRENRNVPEILRIQIIGLGTQVSQRPGAQALKIEAKLEHWYVTGLRQQDIVPSLVASIGDTSSSLLKIEFETNPENSPADQTLIVQSQPVEVIYDALNSKDQGTQKTTNSSLEEIIDKAYDKFDVEIKSVQLLFAKAGI
ncbi:vacuolar protein sorting-associated protein 13C isoform 1 [Cricetulus griseus]|uniref:Vacuolar protein sorting-associated protein 13C isoform 1 n=1 Tax=Cricetulus griseus TaxID=10029 RepID=A0A061I551_CRIGR|nr:vacuolar protein sorting-associated protein 13C isoform 1 [Cricetulus griseus]